MNRESPVMQPCGMTRERLKTRFHYNPVSGELRRIHGDKLVNGGPKVRVPWEDGRDTRWWPSRIAWVLATGKIPVGDIVTLNGDDADLRYCNLASDSAWDHKCPDFS